jgi:lipid-A-disaccharide synthase
MNALSIKVIEDETWDVLAHADLALAASGTVTVEAAVLGTPMVTYYKVTQLTWWAGRRLVKAPYLSMVNLVADKLVVPELIQHDMTPETLAGAASELLEDPLKYAEMQSALALVKKSLQGPSDPYDLAASIVAADLVHA